MQTTKDDIIGYLRARKETFQREYGVRTIGLFGSYARGEASAESDIDIVVELETPDLFYLIGIKQTLEEAFGSKVDVVRLRERMNGSLKRLIQRDAVYV